jgi:ATP-dependent Lon protease
VPSINAVERAVAKDRVLFATAEALRGRRPGPDELYELGTVVRVLQLFRLPDGTLRVLVEGIVPRHRLEVPLDRRRLHLAGRARPEVEPAPPRSRRRCATCSPRSTSTCT